MALLLIAGLILLLLLQHAPPEPEHPHAFRSRDQEAFNVGYNRVVVNSHAKLSYPASFFLVTYVRALLVRFNRGKNSLALSAGLCYQLIRQRLGQILFGRGILHG